MKIIDGVITSTTFDEPRGKRKQRKTEQENLQGNASFRTFGSVPYKVGDGEFPFYMSADRPIYCSCPDTPKERRRMVNNLDYYCETCNLRHLNGKKVSICGTLNTKTCGWKIIRVDADGNCFFNCIQEAIRNTLTYTSDIYIGEDHVPGVYEMRDWWANNLTPEIVSHMLIRIRSFENENEGDGILAIAELYRNWLHGYEIDQRAQSTKRLKADTNQPSIKFDSPLPTGDDLHTIRTKVQSVIRRDQAGTNTVWVDDHGLKTIAERLRLRILIVWTRNCRTSPFYVGGTCDNFVGTVILTNNESHFNLVSWIPPGQTVKAKGVVTIFPRDYYPDLLQRMFCCLHPGDPHQDPLA